MLALMAASGGAPGTWRDSAAVAEECARLLRNHHIGRLLDAGGGNGVLTSYLLRDRDAEGATVLDPSREALAGVPAPIATRRGRIEELGRADGPFDTVLLRQVLHYVDAPVATLRRLRGRLNGGAAVYVGQLVAPDAAAGRWLAHTAQWVSASRRRVWTVDRLLATLARAGLFVERGALVPYWQSLDVRVPAGLVQPGTHVHGTMPVQNLDGRVRCRVLWLHALLRAAATEPDPPAAAAPPE